MTETSARFLQVGDWFRFEGDADVWLVGRIEHPTPFKADGLLAAFALPRPTAARGIPIIRDYHQHLLYLEGRNWNGLGVQELSAKPGPPLPPSWPTLPAPPPVDLSLMHDPAHRERHRRIMDAAVAQMREDLRAGDVFHVSAPNLVNPPGDPGFPNRMDIIYGLGVHPASPLIIGAQQTGKTLETDGWKADDGLAELNARYRWWTIEWSSDHVKVGPLTFYSYRAFEDGEDAGVDEVGVAWATRAPFLELPASTCYALGFALLGLAALAPWVMVAL